MCLTSLIIRETQIQTVSYCCTDIPRGKMKWVEMWSVVAGGRGGASLTLLVENADGLNHFGKLGVLTKA